MKQLRTWLIVLAVLATLLVVKMQFFAGSKPAAPSGPSKPMPALVSVYVVKAEKLGQDLQLSGTVLATEEAMLVSEVGGRIIDVNFEEGANVKSGSLLLKINDTDLQAKRVDLVEKLKLANENVTRYKALFDKGGVSQEQFAEIESQVISLKAQIKVVNDAIDKTEIRAPFDGVVGLRLVSRGSTITANTSIASIQKIDMLKVDFSIPERYSSKVRVGDVVSFTTAGSEEKHEARIAAIEPKVDPATRSLKLRARFVNPSGRIFPGAFANISLSLQQDSTALLIPTEALIPELKGQKVFLCKNGVASPQKVKTGLRKETMVQITEGLNPGDSVVVRGLMQVKPDAPLKIVSN